MKKKLLYLEENFEEILMVIMLILMTIIMGIQVFSRYVLGTSLSWSEEITRYMFIWSAFLSVSLCTRKCISIKIDQFIKMFPPRGEAAIKMLNLTISFIWFAFLLPYAWHYLITTINSGQVSPACGIPMYFIQSAPLITFVLAAIRTVQNWVDNLMIVLGKPHWKAPGSSLSESVVATVEDGIGGNPSPEEMKEVMSAEDAGNTADAAGAEASSAGGSAGDGSTAADGNIAGDGSAADDGRKGKEA
ncbi:MAG: TRAP transporter small permease [Eubacteriales bacterium]|nr:TRAP transporter small permease [Eubacteriales bacterium]